MEESDASTLEFILSTYPLLTMWSESDHLNYRRKALGCQALIG
jgi:hypothetical protein